MPESVLIIEDDAAWRQILRGDLEPYGFVVREAATLRAALDELATTAPDVVILDMELDERPGSVDDGLEVLQTLDTMQEAPEVVVVSQKHFQLEEVRELIGVYDVADLMGKRAYRSDALLAAVERAAETRRSRRSLTPRELQVLQLKCASQTNKQIAHQLGIDLETVKSHVRSVFAKLEVTRGQMEACAKARRLKLL